MGASYCEAMLIVGVLCVCAAVASATFGLWSISRPPTGDPAQLCPRFAGGPLRRAQAPTQLAAAVILASGGAVALAAPSTAVVVVVTCIAGALGTVAAGSWQSARYAVRLEAARADCAGNCVMCSRSCG